MKLKYSNFVFVLLYVVFSITYSNFALAKRINDFSTQDYYSNAISLPNQDLSQFSLVKLTLNDIEEKSWNQNKLPDPFLRESLNLNFEISHVPLVFKAVHLAVGGQFINLLYPFHGFW